MKGKRAAPSTKTSDAKATPALVREYDDDFIVTAVPSEKKNKMDVKFNYHVEINEYVTPDFVECSSRKPRRNLSRAQKRSLTCRTTKEIMDDQQWVLQSKLGMTRARAIGILMDDFDEFSDVDKYTLSWDPRMISRSRSTALSIWRITIELRYAMRRSSLMYQENMVAVTTSCASLCRSSSRTDVSSWILVVVMISFHQQELIGWTSHIPE